MNKNTKYAYYLMRGWINLLEKRSLNCTDTTCAIYLGTYMLSTHTYHCINLIFFNYTDFKNILFYCAISIYVNNLTAAGLLILRGGLIRYRPWNKYLRIHKYNRISIESKYMYGVLLLAGVFFQTSTGVIFFFLLTKKYF
jgi:hypothetical protein